MTLVARLVRFARGLTHGPRPTAELWCRPATVLALRNRNHAPACLAGWR